MKSIQYRHVFKAGWEKVTQYPAIFVGTLVLSFIVQNIPRVVVKINPHLPFAGVQIIAFIASFISSYIMLGYINMTLRATRGEVPQWDDLHIHIMQFIRYTLGGVMVGGILTIPLAVWFSLTLLSGTSPLSSFITLSNPLIISLVVTLVGSLFFVPRIMFFSYVLIDESEVSTETALMKSWNITEGYTASLILLTFFLAIFNLIGALCFGIGLLITIPVSVSIQAYVYEQLMKQSFPGPVMEHSLLSKDTQ